MKIMLASMALKLLSPLFTPSHEAYVLHDVIKESIETSQEVRARMILLALAKKLDSPRELRDFLYMPRKLEVVRELSSYITKEGQQALLQSKL